jgi:putative transposase
LPPCHHEASMIGKGNCWGNAVAESFLSSVKKERIKKRNHKDRALSTADIAD